MTSVHQDGFDVPSLAKQLDLYLQHYDFKSAKGVLDQLEKQLVPRNQTALFMKYKCWLCEAYMDIGDYEKAKHGFIEVISKVAKNTRVSLEAKALLAICFIRLKQMDNAEPYIKEVLQNYTVITSEKKRFEFRKAIIERFEEEGILSSVRDSNTGEIDLKLLENEVQKIINCNPDDIYEMLGKTVPPEGTNILDRISTFSRKQLPTGERKLLSSPIQIHEKENLGRKLFDSAKRTLYNSLCDTSNPVYQSWSKGLDRISGISKIQAIIATHFQKIGLVSMGIIVPIVTLILRFGIEWFCNYNKPRGVMDLR